MAEKRTSLVDRLKNAVRRKSVNNEKKNSVEWLRAKLQNFVVYSRKEPAQKTFDRDDLNKYASSYLEAQSGTMIGKMYMFQYAAKHHETLPFWDKFPLIILVGPAKGGVYGANVHYLPPVLRAAFFDSLLGVINTKDINEKTRFQITYNILKSTRKFRYFAPTFKHYLTPNIKSKIIYIPPTEWGNAVFLENAEWQKAGRDTVYKWSREQIK